MELKDKVKLKNGNEYDITITPMGFIEKNEIMSLCFQTGLRNNSTQGSFDMFRLKSEAIKRFVKGVNHNHITAKEGERLFDKYFAEDFGFSTEEMGNLNETSE